MKNSPTINANAFAVTIGFFYVVCRVLVFLFPELMLSVANTWFHGIAFVKENPGNLSISSFLLGFVSSVVAAWITAYLFVWVRNLMKS